MALDAAEVDLAARGRVQRPVVGAHEDAPQLGVGEVGELRAVVEAQQRDQREDDVAVGAGVGDDHVGALAGVLAVDQVDHVQRVARGARQHTTREPDRLVVEHVQPGRAAAAPEVLGVRARVDAADRDDEAHPVDARDEAAAPPAGQLDRVLRRDQDAVRRGVVRGAQVVLVDVADAPPRQRRHACGDHWDVADVQRVRGQRRGDRDVQTQAAAAAGHADERRDESGVPGHDLQDEVREIGPREHALQPAAQIDEAGRVGDRVDLVRVQPPVGVDMDLRAGDEAVGQRSPGTVEFLGMLGEQLAWVFGQPERVERRPASGIPCRLGEQLRARVAQRADGLA